ncbi:unnamed protein product [Brachionus calyciflorus]|uniref:EF-hand domain-containing protein n=1 Tax=Brachionus calyciflorus TaxID=104777 RepID=A0A813QCS7_9BILA|nr:unnamed protein product [Brachionus calyciflorus]
MSSRKNSNESVLQTKSSLNMYTTPAQTNLNLSPNLKEPGSSNQSKVQILINDVQKIAKEDHVKLEFRLRMTDLEILKSAFDNLQIDKEEQYKLNREEFVNVLNNNLTIGNEQEYEELFDNVDVTQSGYVDWDSFTSYLLIMLYESDDKLKAFSIPNWKPLKTVYNVHRDSIKRIEFVKNITRYITISKEGTCSLFDRNLTMTNHTRIHSDSCKSKDLWVTDFIVLQNVNKVVLAFTTKEISIYELNTKLEFNCQYRIYNLKATPLCLDYWFDAQNPNDSILIWGDTSGYIHKIHFNSTTISLFERPTTNSNDLKTQQKANDTSLDISINEIKEKYKNATYMNYQAHTAWVRQVKWIKNLDAIISCATTNKQSVCIGWFLKKSSHVKVTHLNVSNGGVNGFDFDQNLNLLATANQNTVVNLFNPYVQEPNGILKGHSRVVLAVRFMPSRSQLISFSADKILRIWNVQLQICIQRISNMFPKGPDVDISCYFDELSSRFFIAFRYTLLMMEIKPEITDRILTHSNPVVAVKYNKITNQVVTLSQDGTMYMWLLESGQRIKVFNELHGAHELITMSFDESNTRIMTAASDGLIKIWDLNGHCYHTLEANNGQNCEIGQVLSLKRRIISVGWKKSIAIFRDNTMKDEIVKPSEWKGNEEHEEDILCADIMLHPPMILATGSFDGDIVLWNSVTEYSIKHLSARKRVLSAKIEANMGQKTNKNYRSFTRRPSFKPSETISDTERFIKQNDFSFAITCLKFLNTRIHGKDCTLVSCGGNGWVRFWEITSEKIGAEFIAHKQVNSVIMEIDEKERYLATGDVNGLVKVWNITSYCLSSGLKFQTIKTEPPLVCSLKSHLDQINSINFCEKHNKTYLMLASSDCGVSLNDLSGNLIGIFGQDIHWKLETPNPSLRSTPHKMFTNTPELKITSEKALIVPKIEINSKPEQEEKIENSEPIVTDIQLPVLSQRFNLEETFTFSAEDFINDTTLRYNPWSKTLLGKSYQESRIKKRDRKQPGYINDEDYDLWNKTGQAPGGLYGSLKIIEMENVDNKINKKLEPKFLREKNAQNIENKPVEKTLAETLKSAFDEKTLFPKYILDYEARMRQENKNLINRLNNTKENELNKSMPHKRQGSGLSISNA